MQASLEVLCFKPCSRAAAFVTKGHLSAVARRPFPDTNVSARLSFRPAFGPRKSARGSGISRCLSLRWFAVISVSEHFQTRLRAWNVHVNAQLRLR
jgi:hypothetical protein